MAAREVAAALVAPLSGDDHGGSSTPLPNVTAVKAKLQGDKTLAREIGPQRVRERRQERGLLRMELEWPGAVDSTSPAAAPVTAEAAAAARWLVLSAARDCSWESHWYVAAARQAKASAQVTCVLPWLENKTSAEVAALTPAEVTSDLAAGGWKARLLQEQLGATAASDTVVVVGHSSGGTAALRMAERLPLPRPAMTLIVVGAGYSAQDYECDRQARAEAAGVDVDPTLVIPPWSFGKICANVGRVVLLHGEDDDVILPIEATQISDGLAQAAARLAQRAGPGGDEPTVAMSAAEVVLRLVPMGLGHAMEKQCPQPILDEILSSLLA